MASTGAVVAAGRQGAATALWSQRRLVNGIRSQARTGVPWRDGPVEYGPWGQVYDRKNRAYLRRLRTRCTSPDGTYRARNRRKPGYRGDRPPHVDPVDHRERHAVECAINRLKAPRCSHAIRQPAVHYEATPLVAAINEWL